MIFWRMLVTKRFLLPIGYYYKGGKKLFFTEASQMRVNYARIYIYNKSIRYHKFILFLQN